MAISVGGGFGPLRGQGPPSYASGTTAVLRWFAVRFACYPQASAVNPVKETSKDKDSVCFAATSTLLSAPGY